MIRIGTILIFILCAVLTLTFGDTPLLEVIQGLSNHWNPLLHERLPRLIVLICTGASLAVSGAVMQSYFQNPLASPSILGVSCGGSLLVTVVFILGWQLSYPYTVPMAAFSGSLITLFAVYTLSRRQGQVHTTTLILTGIALSTLLLAIQSAIVYALRDQWQLIQTLSEWEAGSTMDRTWKHVHMQLPVTLIGLFGCWYYRKEVNILTLGEEEATNLGVEVSKVRWRLFLSVALLTGGSIAAVGILPFFGLVLPHVIRRIQGPNNEKLIPGCILLGSTTLLMMDLLLRLFHIQAFSIGNLSAVLGGTFFLILLVGSKKQPLISKV